MNKWLYPDSPKDWFCECEDTSYTKFEMSDNAKEGNGNYMICWNPKCYIQFNERGCKNEKVSWILKQCHKWKEKKNEL